MKSSLSLRQAIGAVLVRGGQIIAPELKKGVIPMEHCLQWSNPFAAQVVRRVAREQYSSLAKKIVPVLDEFGQQVFERRVVQEAHGFNGITIQGKNHLLACVFGNATPVTQIDPWFIGLINQSPTPVLVEADTLASHSGWSELQAYSGNRQEWDDTDASNKVKGTATVSTFAINATGEVHGIFIASVDVGTSGTLWATGGFDSSLNVVDSDELKITYGIRT